MTVDDSYPPIKRDAWHQVDDEAYRETWDRFYAPFKFDPSRGLTEPVVEDPQPSVTFDLSGLGPAATRSAATDAINTEALRCFVSVLSDVDELFVLDWQHSAYRFRPSIEALDLAPRDPVNGYPSVYPDGDNYAFLTPNLREGTFGHPWESSLCIIGERLVNTLGTTLGTWLPIKRSR
jgi:hypothetical protein